MTDPIDNALTRFETYLLRQGLTDGTITTYLSHARAWADADSAREYVLRELTPDVPVGTACGMCAAARHWEEHRGRTWEALPRRTRVRHVELQRDALEPDELASYLEQIDAGASPEPVRTVLLILPFTGLRIGEAISLRHKDVSLRGKHKGLQVLGKGRKVRWIPLTQTARGYLAEYLKLYKPEGPWMFPSPLDEHRHISDKTVRKHLAREREYMMGEAKHVTPHVLRHTAASKLLERGVNLRAIQVILGHSSIKTTERYLHPSKGMLREAMAHLD